MLHTMYYIIFTIISISITSFSILCADARSFAQFLKSQDTEAHKSNSIHELEKKLKATSHLELDLPLPYSNLAPPDVSLPPFSSPPVDSQAPPPSPGNVPLPPYSVYPPFTQHSPSAAPTLQPIPSPPELGPTPYPPSTNIPIPPKTSPIPPPPHSGPATPPPPPSGLTTPPPPPSGPTTPPPHKKPPQSAVWCVAKPTVPDPIMQEAMDYACGSGADCKSIQPNGSCYKPDTLLSHASYAFNSYWQSTKVAGGTCDFGGTAILVTVDPSFDGCQFFYNG